MKMEPRRGTVIEPDVEGNVVSGITDHVDPSDGRRREAETGAGSPGVAPCDGVRGVNDKNRVGELWLMRTRSLREPPRRQSPPHH